MATVKELLGTATAFTITGNIAASGTVGRQSTVVDETSSLSLDAHVECLVTYPNSAPANDQSMYIYAFGSVDGTNYPEGLGASDAAFTFAGAAGALKTSLRIIGVIPAIQNSTTLRFGPFAVAPAFGGFLPVKWGIVLLNYSGQTITTFSAQYRQLTATVV